MQNPRLAGRYAKSLIDLAVERNQLEEVYADLKYLQAVCKLSKPFTNLLNSPIIPIPTKLKAVAAVTKGNVGELTAAFNNLLISKTRENILSEIVEAAIDMYNGIKGIHKVKLTTAVEVSEEVKTAIKNKIISNTNLKNIELTTVVREELIGGFILEYKNNLVDGSVLSDLRNVKRQFDKNVYVRTIR